uniref:Uncharacterized protein n=1 Tax=Phlegmariurus squarrosus TaxID=73615 RepID=H9M836_PHLSQ|nr:hypothetical protein HusqMp28 [Phlegmariurus squarrosus]AEV55743.1 hypothetical protein HusqMp28 [Phlegmariurus squarrosus]
MGNTSSSGSTDFTYCCCNSLNSGKWFFLGEANASLTHSAVVCPAGPCASLMICVLPSAYCSNSILSKHLVEVFFMRHIATGQRMKVLARHKAAIKPHMVMLFRHSIRYCVNSIAKSTWFPCSSASARR